MVFESLRKALLEASVLPYPDPSSSYLLNTDVNAEGVGTMLWQVKDV